MSYLYLPTINPSPLRDETDAGVIAHLTRKGWQETMPPTPGANQTAQWDGTAKEWVLVDNPPVPPNYAGLREGLDESTLLPSMWDKETPTITLSDPSALPQTGASNSLTLNESASSVDGTYVGSLLFVTAGLGNNEAFVVRAYTGATRVANLSRISGNGAAFVLDATSRYRIYAADQLYSGLKNVAGVFRIQETWARFDNILSRFETSGDKDNAVRIARFQTRLSNWVTACDFNVTERDELRALLATYAPTRNYTVPV